MIVAQIADDVGSTVTFTIRTVDKIWKKEKLPQKKLISLKFLKIMSYEVTEKSRK